MPQSKNLHNIWQFTRNNRLLISVFIFSFVTLTVFGALTIGRSARAAGEQDCSTNSIMKCGFTDIPDFIKKYQANKPGDLDDIYRINGSELTQLKGAVKGTVYKDGRVVVNGKVVGTGAKSLGREYMKGSTSIKLGNDTYYYRPTSISFAQNSLEAYVILDKNGKAIAAILTSCGNPVAFTPVTPKTPPKKTTPPPKPETPQVPEKPKIVYVNTPPEVVVQEKEVIKEVTKEVPKELPQTGPADAAATALGIGSLAGSGYYWRSSKRNLLSKLRRQ